jgi:lipopolysaccharide export system protein LptC
MRERLASVVAIVLLALVAATSYWYSRSLNAERAGAPAVLQRVDVDADAVTLIQFDPAGRAQYRLVADRMTHFADTDNVDLAAPRLLSLRADKPRLRASAKMAHVENNGERVRLVGDVVLTRQSRGALPPLRVTTESLLAMPDRDRYTTDLPVRVERGRDAISARGMDLDNVAQRIEFGSDVVDTITSVHR